MGLTVQYLAENHPYEVLASLRKALHGDEAAAATAS